MRIGEDFFIHEQAGLAYRIPTQIRLGEDHEGVDASDIYNLTENGAVISVHATVDPTARIERTVIIEPHAQIGAYATVRGGSIIYNHARIGDYAEVGYGSHVHTGANIKGGRKVGSCVVRHSLHCLPFVGANS